MTRKSRGQAPQLQISAINNDPTANGKAATAVASPARPKKNAREAELDRLVWGDEEGFQAALRDHDAQGAQLMDLGHSSADEQDEDGVAALADSELFFLDAGTDAAPKAAAPAAYATDSPDDEKPPAWVDSDDERLAVSLASSNLLRKLRRYEGEDVINGVEYSRRLQQQFERLYPAPDWAQAARAQADGHRQKRRRLSESGSSSDDISDDDAEAGDLTTAPLAQLLQSSAPLVATGPATTAGGRLRFRPEALDIQRTKDIKGSSPSTISSLSFHPTHAILLSAGPSGLLTLHQISPRAPMPNPTLTSLAVPRLPISTATFHPDGARILFSARRRFFHVWQLAEGRASRVSSFKGLQAGDQKSCERLKPSPCGRYVALVGSARKGGGAINVLDAATMHWRCTARVEGRGGVADFAWWADGDGLVALGKGGDALEYSVAGRRPVARWHDEGAVGATVVALGGGGGGSGLAADRWVAAGSSSGVVVVYDRTGWREGGVPAHPSPTATFQQLTTPTSHLAFSPCGQLLALGSRWKRDALRIAHVGAGRVYPGWPSSGTPLGRVSAVAWGRVGDEGALALVVGNEQGKIRMWEIRG